jgi:hypothetical protein
MVEKEPPTSLAGLDVEVTDLPKEEKPKKKGRPKGSTKVKASLHRAKQSPVAKMLDRFIAQIINKSILAKAESPLIVDDKTNDVQVGAAVVYLADYYVGKGKADHPIAVLIASVGMLGARIMIKMPKKVKQPTKKTEGRAIRDHEKIEYGKQV